MNQLGVNQKKSLPKWWIIGIGAIIILAIVVMFISVHMKSPELDDRLQTTKSDLEQEKPKLSHRNEMPQN